MNKIYLKIVLSALFVLLFFVQCKKDKEEDTCPDSSFDKAAMLSNFNDNLILPAYAELKNTTDSLAILTNNFLDSTSPASLLELQLQFLKAYEKFQNVSVYEFGPADQQVFRSNLNTFPCDTAQINSKIAAADYFLDAATDIDAKGFPAIDFLIYGSNGNAATILNRFTLAANSDEARNYLIALVNDIKIKTDLVVSSWSPSGANYSATFTGNTGSNVGSSIGILVNQLSFDLEILKNAKIGIPAGKKSMGTPLPNKVEAFYSKESLKLAIKNLESIENLYLGKSLQGIDDIGFDDYVTHLNVQHPSGALNDVIKNKFISSRTALASIPNPLNESVVNAPTQVNTAYLELQQLIVLLKVDMTSALGVLITYQDNDGD
jgi:predicted lipoprotein